MAAPHATSTDLDAPPPLGLSGADPASSDHGSEGSGAQDAQSCHCLEFDSWWNEGRNRRFVYIRYNIVEGAFQMAIDEDSNLYHVPVVYGAKTGEAVTVWDLHVGAELDILGRITTLQRCSQTTAQWNKYWADRLIATRNRLLEELRKYELKKVEPWLTFQKPSPHSGSADLRLLMGQVAALGSQLAEYRPRLAAQLGLPKEMYEIEVMPKQVGGKTDNADEVGNDSAAASKS
mmetsp:Transcript_73979/g.154206  ORF Transcript_73979/g.154206 Transcript_73979/m.154206 type:complete len:233 (-) Transcript_73979:124-822(-)